MKGMLKPPMAYALRHNLFFALIPLACQHARYKAQKKMADFDEIDHLLACRGGGIAYSDPYWRECSSQQWLMPAA